MPDPIRKQKLTDKKISKTNYNKMVGAVNELVGGNPNAPQRDGLRLGDDYTKPVDWEVTPIGAGNLRIKLGDARVGQNQNNLQWEDITSSWNANLCYTSISSYGYDQWDGDYRIVNVGDKFTTPDSFPVGGNTATSNGKRDAYLMLSMYSTSSVDGFGDAKYGYLYVTNSLGIAGQVDIGPLDDDQKKNIQHISRTHIPIAQFEIDSCKNVSNLEQLNSGTIQMDSSYLDSESTRYIISDIPQNGFPSFKCCCGAIHDFERCTIEAEDCECWNRGVNQLHNANTAQRDSFVVPYLDTCQCYETINGQQIVGGALQWAAFDGEHCVNDYNNFDCSYYQETLDVKTITTPRHDDGNLTNEQIIQLHNVECSNCNRYALPMLQTGVCSSVTNAPKSELCWMTLDSYYNKAYGVPANQGALIRTENVVCIPASLETYCNSFAPTCNSTKFVGLFDFPTPNIQLFCDAGIDDKILWRKCEGVGSGDACLAYMNLCELAKWLICCSDVSGGGCLYGCYKSHHALNSFDPIEEVVGANWGQYDDHGGNHRFTASTNDGYRLMLLGNPTLATLAERFDRNAANECLLLGGDHVFGDCLRVECGICVDGVSTGPNFLIDGDVLRGIFDNCVCIRSETDMILAGNSNTYLDGGNLRLCSCVGTLCLHAPSTNATLEAAQVATVCGGTAAVMKSTGNINLESAGICVVKGASTGLGITDNILNACCSVCYVNGIAVNTSAGTGGAGFNCNIPSEQSLTFGDNNEVSMSYLTAGDGTFSTANTAISSDFAWSVNVGGVQTDAMVIDGATATLDLCDNNICNVGHVAFDLLHGEDPELGTLNWNCEDGTLNVGLEDNVNLQVGQETHFRVKNQTGACIADGTGVQFAGTVGASGRLLICEYIANNTVDSKFFMGVTTNGIANGADGYVTSFGLVRGIDTTGTAVGETWNDGDILYASPLSAGYFTNVEPDAPNNNITVAAVVNADATVGSIFVRPSFAPKIESLQDIDGTPLTTDGQFLVWNNATSYFDANYNINDYSTTASISSTYLKLDTSNDPLVGDLEVCKVDPSICITDTGDNNYATWNRSDTCGCVVHKNIAATQLSEINCLVSQYKMNDAAASTTVLDTCALNNGTAQQNTNVLCSAGKINGTLCFNGTSDYVNINNLWNDVSSTACGTWSLWVKPDNLQTGHPIMFGNNTGGSNKQIRLVSLSNGKVQAIAFDGAFKWDLITCNAELTSGCWSHVTLTHDGTTPTLYIDGVCASQKFNNQTDKTWWLADDTLDRVSIGRFSNGAATTQYFDGCLDDIRFYTCVLDQSQIDFIYAMGSGTEANSGASDVEQTYLSHKDGSAIGEAGIVTLGHACAQVDINADCNINLNDNVHIPSDTDKLYLGLGDDASINYNGTDLVINPQEVGTGVVNVCNAAPAIELTDTTDGNCATWTRSDTNACTQHKSIVCTVGGTIGCLYQHMYLDDCAVNATVTDSSGNGRTGCYCTDATTRNTCDGSVTGKIIRGLDFRGIDPGGQDFVDLGCYDIGTRAWSMGGWFNFDTVAPAANKWVTSYRGSGGNAVVFQGLILTTGEFFLGTGDVGSNTCSTCTCALTQNTWYHIMATSNGDAGDEVKVYLDGTCIGSHTLTCNGVQGAYNHWIGGQSWSTAGKNAFNGQADDYRLYNCELTPAEVCALWNSGSGCQGNTAMGSDVERTYLTHEDAVLNKGNRGIVTLGYTGAGVNVCAGNGICLNDNVVIQSDTDTIKFGASCDVCMGFDGSQLRIKSDNNLEQTVIENASTLAALYLHNCNTGTTLADGGLVGMQGLNLTITNAEAGCLLLGTNADADRAYIDADGTFHHNFGITKPIRAITASTTLATSDYTVLIDASGGAVTACLPAAPNEGQIFNLKAKDATNTVCVDPNTNCLDGTTAGMQLIEDEVITVQYDGTSSWWII